MAQRGGRNPARYRHIADDLRKRINDGEWPVDTLMPTLAMLQKEYDASKGTIDKALGLLRDEGIAETIHGTGTFVRTPPPDEASIAAQVERLTQQYRRLAQRVDELEARDHARQ